MQTPLVVLFIKDILGRGDVDLGLILSASGLGGIAGALAGGMLQAGRRPLRTVTWLLAVDGVLLMLFAVNRNIWLAMALFGMFGAIGTVAQISLATFLQRETPENQRGRVFGWLGAFMGPLSLLSVTVGSLAADAVGVVLVLVGSGCFELLVGLAGRFTLPAQRPVAKSAESSVSAGMGAASAGEGWANRRDEEGGRQRGEAERQEGSSGSKQMAGEA
jgi:predicted MFS family arabinose efflux permease